MNTKTGVKDTEVVSTREKENGSDEGQTKIDSEAAKPKAPKLSSSPMSIPWFPGDMATSRCSAPGGLSLRIRVSECPNLHQHGFFCTRL